MTKRLVFLAAFAIVAASGPVRGQVARGGARTVAGDAMRGEDGYLRGMAWYDLGNATANAIDAEAASRWNRAVQADYRAYMADRARRAASRQALRNEREADALARMEATRRRWRENPTLDDIRSGATLNAVASDLADPAIAPERWREAKVELPAGVSIRALTFRFADTSAAKMPPGKGPPTVAVGKMEGKSWPVALRRAGLDRERAAYRRAVEAVFATCAAGKTLQAREVDAVRDALAALKARADVVVPAGALRKQADAHLERLDAATRIFLRRGVAEELVRDVSAHEARTVGELLAFMKKYRLVFAEADDDPEAWAAYQTLNVLLRRQAAFLAPGDAPGARKGE